MQLTHKQIRALEIVYDLANENVIDPREGEDYAEIRIEQEGALETVQEMLGKPFWLPANPQPEFEVLDELLVAIRTTNPPWNEDRWKFQVIVAAEQSFENPDGTTWTDFSWADVSYYHILKQAEVPPYKETS